MEEILYLAVSNDKYELPLKVARTSAELARWADMAESNMSRYISNGKASYRNKCRFLKLRINNNEN